MQRLPLSLLAHGQDPPGAPLQAHLLPAVPGDHVTGQGRAAHRGLPFVSQGDLHRTRPQPARSTVGQQHAVGADTRGGGGGGGWTDGVQTTSRMVSLNTWKNFCWFVVIAAPA